MGIIKDGKKVKTAVTDCSSNFQISTGTCHFYEVLQHCQSITVDDGHVIIHRIAVYFGIQLLPAIQVFYILLNIHFYQDRKSTRLNSSHVAISYAVYCLNKKKNGYESRTDV